MEMGPGGAMAGAHAMQQQMGMEQMQMMADPNMGPRMGPGPRGPGPTGQ